MLKLSEKKHYILQCLLNYRGMNVRQMTSFMYRTLHYTNANLKQTQRDLKELQNAGYVTIHKYKESIIVDEEGTIRQQPISLYYLTEMGYEITLANNNVLPGQVGGSFFDEISSADYIIGDIPYKTHIPPLKYIEHHLMFIDSMIEVVCHVKVPHRGNLYCVHEYENGKLKPDAEIWIDEKIVFLEFDRDTENFEHLVKKFQNYDNFLNSLSETERNRYIKIIFVLNEEKKWHMKRRFAIVLAAFFKGMIKHRFNIDLILCSTSQLRHVLIPEIDKGFINDRHLSFFQQFNNYKTAFYLKSSNRYYKWICNKDELHFSLVVNKFDSSIYRYLYYFFINKQSYTLSNEAQIICLYDSDYDVDEDFTYDLYLNPVKYELDETITFLHNHLNKMNLKGYHFNVLWYLLLK